MEFLDMMRDVGKKHPRAAGKGVTLQSEAFFDANYVENDLLR
jgi:hypothetical protein